ncbi:MAG: AAA family ATPase [bacterium]
MYYEYWGMQRAPFDNVPDPSLYWSENSSAEDAVSETLFAIEEGNDCLAVITGDVGTGKTMCLRVILNELDPKKYRIAFITNPDLSSLQLMREIVAQLKNEKNVTRYKDELMEEFNSILFECANKGQKVVIFIDEANVMSPTQLHSLRLMTNLQDDQQNLIIFVLAGQRELGKRLESKPLENLYQRIGVYCRIHGMSGPDEVQRYLAHRIQSCGGSPNIFTKEASEAIWNYSHRGVPRLVNKIAKLCLKAGETNQAKQIDVDMVKAIASMFEREKGSFSMDLQEEDFSEGEDKEQVEAKESDTSLGIPDLHEPASPDLQIAGEPALPTPQVPGEPPFPTHQMHRESVPTGPQAQGRQAPQPPQKIPREPVLTAPQINFQQSPVNLRQEDQSQLQQDGEMESLLQGLSDQVRNQLYSMGDKQLMDLAGKMAVQHIQQTQQKSAEDPVTVWHMVKSRIFTALKSMQDPNRYYTTQS